MLLCVFHFCLVYVVCFSQEIESIDNFKNGWIPTSSDKINSLLRKSYMKFPPIDFNTEAIHVPNYNFIKFKTPEIENENIETVLQKSSKVYNVECKEQDKTNCYKTNEENLEEQSSNIYFTPNINQIEESSYKPCPSNTYNRRAKVISKDFDSNTIFKDIKTKLETKDNKFLPDSKEVVIVEENRNNYEVTELDEADTPNTVNVATELGFQLEPPKDEIKLSGNNLTNAFLTILYKHNIGTDDNLSNYDLSRRYQNNQGLPKDELAYSSANLPYRYNNLNHLPVNPLLAVLLSNYGYYLPGSYGIQRNYNNLYGYLASNNIHNNKPFGLYKIFSDTDALKQ